MSKTSIHFEPCNVVKSERHNSRTQKLDYIFPELSKNNESLCFVTNLKQREKDCQDLYQEKVGQKMQAKTVPIREGVVVINEKTTMADLVLLSSEIRNILGWTPLQIHIHRDEGYVKSRDNKGGPEVAKLNLHAHLVFDCQDKNTGKMCRNNKYQMSQVQDLCARFLGMERGQKSTRQHLKSLEYKIAIKEENFKNLERQYQDLSAENESLKKKINYFQSYFNVSEKDIDSFEIKGFLGSKIDKKRLKELIVAENSKKALNQKLQGENEVLQKKIRELENKNSLLIKKAEENRKKYEFELKEKHKLNYQIENPSEDYLRKKVGEYLEREKKKEEDIQNEAIKKEIMQQQNKEEEHRKSFKR